MAAVTGSYPLQTYHWDGQVVGPQWVGTANSSDGEAGSGSVPMGAWKSCDRITSYSRHSDQRE